MIASFESNFLKNELLLQAYKKAQILVNRHAERPQSLKSPDYVDRDEEITFSDFVPNILSRFYESVNQEPIHDDDFQYFLSNMEMNVQENMHVDSVYYFHFGLLLDNEANLDADDFKEFTERFHQAFQCVTGTSIFKFTDFYQKYIHHQFFNAKPLEQLPYARQCDFTYVMYCDYEYHDLSNFGPMFMGAFAEFARAYSELYNDLESLIHRTGG